MIEKVPATMIVIKLANIDGFFVLSTHSLVKMKKWEQTKSAGKIKKQQQKKRKQSMKYIFPPAR